ncbi:MAG TPA: phage tail sheath subtilisin-like domain-containing protein [Longimicrobium sp.]|jgi:hypothetical protein|uniref:phage tail sheath family protein n=1 Tax=Longimicrobium sp. TaxID=2029185 RepID=UPI002ED8EDB0
MPEYLAPGVYVEEVSFRSKSIEGVPTSTTGMAGMTRYGPVQYTGGPGTSEPRLITSFTEFERVYGGLEPLELSDEPGRVNYTAHAARAFFLNGGKRLYVSRVFGGDAAAAVAGVDIFTAGTTTARWEARWPGTFGNVRVDVGVQRSRNVAFLDPVNGTQAKRVRHGAVVEIFDPLPADPRDLPGPTEPLSPTATLAAVSIDANGVQTFIDSTGSPVVVGGANVGIFLIEASVAVRVDLERIDFYSELAFYPGQKRYLGRILEREDPADENAVVCLAWEPQAGSDTEELSLAVQLAANLAGGRLQGGADGALIADVELAGSPADPDISSIKATGLEALEEIDDIAIVAAPDTSTMADPVVAARTLVDHASKPQNYRIAVVDGPPEASMNQIRDFRGQFDSTYAALYHPWVEILDPLERAAQGAPPRKLLLPPSGFVTGIYARNDIERGVHKAPANEIVRGLTRFEININKPRQDVLNPEGINALRFFEGRGNRVWGARTTSSDPEWKYVNVRRLFIYLEHSIEKATQWAVFEPNGPRLWANIRRAVEDFLLVQWRDGALLGNKPEEAYFVRCDRTTMTQNDLDNGRLICLIGVAPVKPAEFVIFRIGQWTGDAVLNPTS